MEPNPRALVTLGDIGATRKTTSEVYNGEGKLSVVTVPLSNKRLMTLICDQPAVAQ